MFRELLKENMKMDKRKIKDILEKAEYGLVSTYGEDGYPYGFPMSHILMDDSIYFHCGLRGHKIDNLSFTNKVCFTVVGKTNLRAEIQDTDYESIIVFGRAREVYGQEKIKALREIIDKYAKGYEKEGYKSIGPEIDITKVYKIDIDHISGKERKDGKR